MGIHTLVVDQNVFYIPTVHVIELVLNINVLTLAQERVHPMLYVK